MKCFEQILEETTQNDRMGLKTMSHWSWYQCQNEIKDDARTRLGKSQNDLKKKQERVWRERVWKQYKNDVEENIRTRLKRITVLVGSESQNEVEDNAKTRLR